jgi:hypothetical protein
MYNELMTYLQGTPILLPVNPTDTAADTNWINATKITINGATYESSIEGNGVRLEYH